MNNEPVAWMQDYQDCKCPDNETRCFSDRVFRMMQKHTHPVKELTDEEILREAYYILMREQQRKASEK